MRTKRRLTNAPAWLAEGGRTRRAHNLLLASLAFAVLYFGSASAARADVTCEATRPEISVVKVRVTYYGPFSSASTDLRADPNDAEHKVRLRGLLYYPSGTVRDAPVIIYNHGYERDRGEPSAIARYFVKRGFVVFAPLRRGHIYEEGFRSTGVHIDRVVNKCRRSQASAEGSDDLPFLFCGSVFCRQEVSCSDPDRDNAVEVDYLRRQRDDVEQQIRFIKERPSIGGDSSGRLADPKRIAILGHSFGGALAIFSNGFAYGQNVAVDVSGAELSWSAANPFWERDLRDAMNSQARPMYFLQPKNGRSLLPTRTLFTKAVNQEYRSQASIFPQAPWDSDCFGREPNCWDEEKGEVLPEWKQAHATFVTRDDQVELWGCSVIEFVNRYRLP